MTYPSRGGEAVQPHEPATVGSGSDLPRTRMVLTEDVAGLGADADGRRRWNVVARKIPYARRDVARSVLPDEVAVQERKFLAVGQECVTPDNDPDFPVGSTATYSLMLTDAEARRFRGASNALDVAPAVQYRRPHSPELVEHLASGVRVVPDPPKPEPTS